MLHPRLVKSLAVLALGFIPQTLFAFTGLIESWSKGIFFAIYWPLLVAIASFIYACKLAEAIMIRQSYEKDAMQSKRMAFGVRMTYILLGVSAILLLYQFDVVDKMYSAYENGVDWMQQD